MEPARPATRLSQAFIQLAGAKSLEDLIEGLIMGRYQLDGGAAQTIFKTAESGDAVAVQIVRQAGEALADLAAGVIRQLQFEALEFEVVLVGSLFNGGPLLVDPLRQAVQRVAPGASLTRLGIPPVVGAVLLGMEQGGVRPSDHREELVRSARRYPTGSSAGARPPGQV